MKWEFTSWGELGTSRLPGGPGWHRWERARATSTPPAPAVPLVSKMCPSDVYRVWKRGESLRVDTSLLGFEHMTWQRGRRSFIFKGQGELRGAHRGHAAGQGSPGSPGAHEDGAVLLPFPAVETEVEGGGALGDEASPT